MGNEILLETKALTKTYGTVVKTKVLRGIDLQFQEGEFSSLIGFSGSGKTTLLNLLGTLDRPTTGDINFRGKSLNKMKKNELADFRNQHLGFIFQFHHLLPEFSALENVLIPTWIRAGTTTKKKLKRAQELLEMVGLEEKMNVKSTNLSGGQQQRVAIARALINDPDIILADEPTGNLDTESTDQVYGILREMNKNFKTTFIIVTHDRHLAAKSDRVIEMIDGKIKKDAKNNFFDEEEVWKELAPKHCKYCNKDISVVTNL